MRISILIPGASGLNWPRWKTLVRAVEALGFDGISRTDHFLDHWVGSQEDALEAYVSLAWAADNTERIEIGVLVSPLSFRDPRILAWQATAINDLAQGRLRLGLGAGWQENEHDTFGFELGSVRERSERFAEGVQVVKALTRSENPISLDGSRYPLKQAQLRPRWPDSKTPAIVIGGNGMRRTLQVAAEHADEWNGMLLSNEEFQTRNARLDVLLEEQGRDRRSVRRSVMSKVHVAPDQETLNSHPESAQFEDMRSHGAVIGTSSQVVDILGKKAEVGIEAVMLQWLTYDDIAGLELIAKEVLPHVQ